jgi:polysaccharide biosynthesis PFTS motif protein
MNLPLLDQFVLDKTCQELDIKITLVCTQSVLLSPPLAFYYEKNYINSKMGFWYSDNNLAIPHNSQSPKDFSYDFFRVDLLDRIFVWSESYAAVLREHTEAEIEVTDPILMNNHNQQSPEFLVKNKTKTISFFGISPLHNLANLHFNQLQNAIDDLAAFSILIQDETFSQVNFILKVKREFNGSYHYQNYFRMIMNISELRNVKIVTGEERALEVIRKSNLVVCTPYTSAALIAKHFGIKTVFFTDKNHYQLPVRYEGIDVLVGKDSLYKHLIAELFTGR